MTETIKITTKSEGLEEALKFLEDDEQVNNILFEGLKAGGKVLQESAKSLFKAKLGEGASHYSRFIKKPFYEGVKLITDKAYGDVIVSIMSDFRMRFYEKQIQLRRTKKGFNRGIVKANHFFSDARNNSDSEIEKVIYDKIEQKLNNSLK